MNTLTSEQQFEIVERSLAANRAGDIDESVRISKLLPLAPHLAMAVKESFGKEHLLNGGYDLSEAEAEYGKDWLTR